MYFYTRAREKTFARRQKTDHVTLRRGSSAMEATGAMAAANLPAQPTSQFIIASLARVHDGISRI